MSDIIMGGDDTLIEDEGVTIDTSEGTTKDEAGDEEETVEQLRDRLKKAEELAHNQKVRAEKAESKLKKGGDPKKEEKAIPSKEAEGLTNSDMFALVKANIAEEDIDEVRDYASLKGISIREALNASFVKSLLSEKAEQRKTAEATNTGTSRRASTKTTEQLLSEAENGNLPDDPALLAKARFQRKVADKDFRKR